MENKWYTISVYSENSVGLLNRISGIFLKRHINIESLNVSKSEIENVSKFTIVVFTTEDWVRNIVGQVEKQIEVIKAFYHTDDETIYQESALFKIASDLLFDERQIQNIIKESQWKTINSLQESIKSKEKEIQINSDTLTKLKNMYGIYDSYSQAEVIASQKTKVDSDLAGKEAQLAIMQKFNLKRDSINKVRALVAGLREKKERID